MPSLLLQYDNRVPRTRMLEGHIRSLACDLAEKYLILVGNNGRVLRIQDEQSIGFDAPTKQNLRALSVNPTDGTALIVGNAGTVLLFDKKGDFTKIDVPTSENLRAVSWNAKGDMALMAGNAGILLKYSDGRIDTIDAGMANLRHISWGPMSGEALIASNCFAEEFIPSPNLFGYDATKKMVTPLNEGRADLIGVDWNPDGESALAVGYDVVWHNGFIGNFDGASLSSIKFENKHVYPVAVAWDPSGEVAAIVTAAAQPGMGKGIVFLWDGEVLEPIYTNDDSFFSAVTWNRKTRGLAAIASTASRAFNC